MERREALITQNTCNANTKSEANVVVEVEVDMKVKVEMDARERIHVVPLPPLSRTLENFGH